MDDTNFNAIERLKVERDIAARRRSEAHCLAYSSSSFDFYAFVVFMVAIAFAVVVGSFLLFAGHPEAKSILQDWWIGIAEILVVVVLALTALMMSCRLVRHRDEE